MTGTLTAGSRVRSPPPRGLVTPASYTRRMNATLVPWSLLQFGVQIMATLVHVLMNQIHVFRLQDLVKCGRAAIEPGSTGDGVEKRVLLHLTAFSPWLAPQKPLTGLQLVAFRTINRPSKTPRYTFRDAAIDDSAAALAQRFSVDFGIVLPQRLAIAGIEGIDDVAAGRIHHAIDHDRGRFHAAVDVQLAGPGDVCVSRAKQ